MRAFARLFGELERARRRDEKLDALVRYFRGAPDADAAWAAFLLSGRGAGRPVAPRRLLEWAARAAGLPEWLAEESYRAVGDLAETAALLSRGEGDVPLRDAAARLAAGVTEESAAALWRGLGPDERVVWNKLATGGFRPGVSRQLVARAIADARSLEPDAVAHRLEGEWDPTPESFARLVDPETGDAGESRPYAPALARDLDEETEALGPPDAWLAEWKWDGLRAELVRRGGRTYLWSRGELVTERYPEVADAARALPDGTVLDGVLVAIAGGLPLPSSELRRRDAAKTVAKKLLAEAPAALVTFDLLERGGRDGRDLPFAARRAGLEEVLAGLPEAAPERLLLSPLVSFASWDDLDRRRPEARARRAEGLVLKRRDAPYRAGRGDAWRVWRVDPFAALAVLVYAERGPAGPEFTFAVWDEGDLVPFAKTGEGLASADVRKLDRFARFNTVETFGPVRRLRPLHVFELAFEAVERAPRRKSGVAARSPRVVAWRADKRPEDADTLETVRAMLDEVDG